MYKKISENFEKWNYILSEKETWAAVVSASYIRPVKKQNKTGGL